MLSRITQVISRSMAANDMEGDKLITWHFGDFIIKVFQHHLVMARFAIAQFRVITRLNFDSRDAATYAFTTAIVLFP